MANQRKTYMWLPGKHEMIFAVTDANVSKLKSFYVSTRGQDKHSIQSFLVSLRKEKDDECLTVWPGDSRVKDGACWEELLLQRAELIA